MSKKHEEKASIKSLTFIKEVAKYFMDFLETDFHRRRTPKRSVRSRSGDNLLIGLNLHKYPSFNSIVWKSISHSFDKSELNSISKGVHKTNIPKNLLDLIKLQSDQISAKQINQILAESADGIEKFATLNKKDYEKAFGMALEQVSKIIKDNLVLPFVSNLEKPLEGLDLGDENIIYLMEEELTSVLTSSLENKIAEVVKRLLAQEKVHIEKELKQIFDIEEVKSLIYTFFEAFKVTDIFSELFEMERNKNILDKQEFYLYFCDITLASTPFLRQLV